RAAHAEPEIATQRKIGGPPVDAAVQRTYCRQRKPLDGIEQLLEIAVETADDRIDRVPRAERSVSGAGEYQRPRRRIELAVVQVAADNRDIVRIDAVVLGGPAQADRGDRAGDFERGRTIISG